jgi:hypothetical protein
MGHHYIYNDDPLVKEKKMKFGKAINHEIRITPTNNNGFIAKVGCATFCYSDKESLLKDFDEFLSDPMKLEKEYNETDGNAPDAINPVRRPMGNRATLARIEPECQSDECCDSPG